MRILRFETRPKPEDIVEKFPELAGKEVKLGLLEDGSYVLLIPEDK